MLKQYHVEMMHLALGGKFSSQALEKMIGANLHQDRLRGQIGHEEYHFDNNAFEKSYAYIEEQRMLTLSALMANDVASAWSAFGRLTHTAQDFYAHSNYIDLWLSCQPDGALPTPAEVDPIDPDLINTQALRSGRVYLPLEALTIVRPLKPLVKSLLPRDSHAWMNLDSPTQGSNFKYAFRAAVKRTKIEFEKTTLGFSEEMRRLFLDR